MGISETEHVFYIHDIISDAGVKGTAHMEEPIRFRGSEHGVRREGEQKQELGYQVESVIDSANGTAAVRLTSDQSSYTCGKRFNKPSQVFVLTEIDSLRKAMAYRESPCEPMFKDKRTRVKELVPPDGQQWCSFCLGIPHAAAECAYCHGSGLEPLQDERIDG